VKCRLLNLLAALSLVLCAATVVLWVRSYRVGDMVHWHNEPADFEFYSCLGLLEISWGERPSYVHPQWNGWEGTLWPFKGNLGLLAIDLSHSAPHNWNGFGFGSWRQLSPGYRRLNVDCVVVPYWFLSIITSAASTAALAWLWSERRSWRYSATGHCSKCGYDLRATPDRCPECGTRPLGNTSAQLTGF
jgi:hypothetical protein